MCLALTSSCKACSAVIDQVTPLLSGLEWRCILGVLASNVGVYDLTAYLSVCSMRITGMAYYLAYGPAGR